jgi:hypothetical protein
MRLPEYGPPSACPTLPMDSVDVTTLSEADARSEFDAPTERLTPSTRSYEARPEAPAAPPAVVAARQERCAECGAPMAEDQRYCVECGERRGERRFSLTDDHAPQAHRSTPAPPSGRRPGVPPSTTLIAGVGTLLLAMGVGVLIGRSGKEATPRSAPPAQIVTIAGAGSTASPTSTATTSTTTTGSSTASSKSTKASTTKTTKASKLPAATVKIGSPGKGRGYKNGHFTGEFFGEEEK